MVLFEQVDTVFSVWASEVFSISTDDQLLNFISSLVRNGKICLVLLLKLSFDAHDLDLTLGQSDKELTIWRELHASDQSLSSRLTILRVTNLGSFLWQHCLICIFLVFLCNVIENDQAKVVLVVVNSDPAIVLGHSQVWLTRVDGNCWNSCF